MVDGQYGERGVAIGLVIDVSRVTQTLVLALEGFLFVDSHCGYAAILTEILVAPQSLFLRYIWREPDQIQRVSLQNSHTTKFLLKTLLLGRVSLFFLRATICGLQRCLLMSCLLPWDLVPVIMSLSRCRCSLVFLAWRFSNFWLSLIWLRLLLGRVLSASSCGIISIILLLCLVLFCWAIGHLLLLLLLVELQLLWRNFLSASLLLILIAAGSCVYNVLWKTLQACCVWYAILTHRGRKGCWAWLWAVTPHFSWLRGCNLLNWLGFAGIEIFDSFDLVKQTAVRTFSILLIYLMPEALLTYLQ